MGSSPWRFVSLTFCCLALSSCLHSIPLTHAQECAEQGMYLSAVSMGNAEGSAWNYHSGVTTASAYSESAMCMRPANEAQMCEIKKNGEAATGVRDWNHSSLGAKNFLIGTGYVLYVLPGIAAYYYFDQGRDEVIAKSVQITGTISECSVPGTAH